MNRLLNKMKEAEASEEEFLNDTELEAPAPPNPMGQAAVNASNGETFIKNKTLGRPKTGRIPIEIELSEFDRPNDTIPTFFVSGQGGRKGTKNITISVPANIYDRIQEESPNVNATYAALLKYALDRLDERGKGLSIKHIKHR